MSEASTQHTFMLPDHNLGLDLMRATEAAALAASYWIGRGNKNAGDGGAVDAMRSVLNAIRMDGTVIIGEGEKDEAPMLHNGEKVGAGSGPAIDIAVDPIDGTRLMAEGMRNSIAVIAASPAGTMFTNTECFYMNKLATGPEAADVLDIDAPIADIIAKIAKAKGKAIGEVTVALLNRDRHKPLMAEIRAAGARTRLYTDGDVAASVAAADDFNDVDLLAGIGGSPEGVITACAMHAMGGRIVAKLAPTSDEERQKTIDSGIDPDQALDTFDLVGSKDTLFVATGITDGDMCHGVHFSPRGASTQSIVMRSSSGTVRFVDALHNLKKVHDYAERHGSGPELGEF